MKESPSLFCLGELCARQKYGFKWPPGATKPEFVDPEGKPLPVRMRGFVPTIVGAAEAAWVRTMWRSGGRSMVKSTLWSASTSPDISLRVSPTTTAEDRERTRPSRAAPGATGG